MKNYFKTRNNYSFDYIRCTGIRMHIGSEMVRYLFILVLSSVDRWVACVQLSSASLRRSTNGRKCDRTLLQGFLQLYVGLCVAEMGDPIQQRENLYKLIIR